MLHFEISSSATLNGKKREKTNKFALKLQKYFKFRVRLEDDVLFLLSWIEMIIHFKTLNCWLDDLWGMNNRRRWNVMKTFYLTVREFDSEGLPASMSECMWMFGFRLAVNEMGW